MDLTKQLITLRQNLSKVEGVNDGIFERIDAISDGVSAYAGIDPDAANLALVRVTELEASATDLSAQLATLTSDRDAIATERDSAVSERDRLTTDMAARDLSYMTQQKELIAVRGLAAAGVLNDYEDLLQAKVVAALEVAEDGTITAPDNLYSGLKQQYSAAFHATDAMGSGGQASESPAATETTTVVKANGQGVVSGVNHKDVLTGKVKISSAA